MTSFPRPLNARLADAGSLGAEWHPDRGEVFPGGREAYGEVSATDMSCPVGTPLARRTPGALRLVERKSAGARAAHGNGGTRPRALSGVGSLYCYAGTFAALVRHSWRTFAAFNRRPHIRFPPGAPPVAISRSCAYA
jgi:hypothetical protein